MRAFITFMVIFLVIIKCTAMNSSKDDVCANDKSFQFARRRRYLTFPQGSTVVLTLSVLKTFMTHVPSGWNLALEIDVIYPLPDEKYTNSFIKKLHHRQKRKFWEKLAAAIDVHNINGRACVLRSICEAKINLAPPGKSLVHDILRAIFTAPINDKDFKEEIQGTYNELSISNFCDTTNDCPFSILDFIFALKKDSVY